MRTNLFAYLALSFLTAGLGAQTKPAIKTVPISRTSPDSGKDMFVQYCAACHGADGAGNGPAASALKKAPTDLTKLAARNGGKYPDLQVAETLSAKYVAAHGSVDMPVWGNLFKTLNDGSDGIVHMRVVNLTSYIGSLQSK